MKVKKGILIYLGLVFVCIQAFGQGMVSGPLNFSSFSPKNSAQISAELNALTPSSFHSHPEYGILPIDAPQNSIELIDKRTDSTRYYVEKNNHTTFYLQKAYGTINYKDALGYYREIDTRLFPGKTPGTYVASSQPHPTGINAELNEVFISNNGIQFKFCKNLSLFKEDNLGNKTILASADWTNATFGSDGMKIINIFPDIDLELITLRAGFESVFIINKKPLLLANEWLGISDDLDFTAGTSATTLGVPDAAGRFVGDISFANSNGGNFKIYQGIVSDSARKNISNLQYRISANNFHILVSGTWLNASTTKFPVYVDPTVTNSNTLAQASITGSGLNNTGAFVGFCSYNLTVARPPNCTMTNIQWSFNYRAIAPAKLNEGAIDFLLGACRSPAAAGFFWFCNSVLSGTCTGNNIGIWADMSPCVSPIAACAGNLTFTMRFYDRFAGAACSNAFIAANSAWTMLLTGRNLETLANTATGNGNGAVAATCYAPSTLNPAPANGVPGYTYLWSTGQISPTIAFTPTNTGSSVFTCTVTDACGVVRVATITVNNNCVLPVELLSYTSTYNGNSVVLDWSTATETNSDYFLVEKSVDGIHFEFLEKISAAGNSSSTKKYKVFDNEPYKKGTSYYRLKQYDKDGSMRFSQVNSINVVEMNYEVQLIPNPSSNNIEIKLADKWINNSFDVEIMDVNGKSQLTYKNSTISETSKSINVNISNLADGVYFVKITANDGTQFKGKLIKN